MIDASFNAAVFPWDPRGQAATHDVRLVYQGIHDPLNAVRQSLLIDSDRHTGREAWDWQNPYRITAAQMLTKATLVPDYGLRGDTPAGVAANIDRYSGLLENV